MPPKGRKTPSTTTTTTTVSVSTPSITNDKNDTTKKLINTALSSARKPPQPEQPILETILNEDKQENNEELYEEEHAHQGDQIEGQENNEEILYEEENLDYEANYDEEVDYGVGEATEGDSYYPDIEGTEGGILTGLKYDPLLPPINDDPREGKRIKKKGKGRNTESFDPKSTLVRPDMRIIVGPNTDVYDGVLKHDDVVIVPDFFCQKDDWTLYYKLIEEMRDCQAHGEKDAEWISWHEGAHLISKNPSGSATYQDIQAKISQYFNIPMQSVGTRFNWYRNSSDWKPFHHDSAAYNHQRAHNQNITVGVSFGSTRELAFLNVKNGSKIYFPQTNGMLFSFGRDVNIQWKHGVNALPEEEQDGRGRISIILWGLAQDVIEEANSPPMVNNSENYGGVPREARKTNHFRKNTGPNTPQNVPANGGRKVMQAGDNRDRRAGDRPLFVLSEDRERMERERLERERIERERDREREREREREWERERERRAEWERQQRGPYGRSRSRSRSRERRIPPPDYDRDRGMDRRDRDYYPPPSSYPPTRDYPPRDDRGRYSNAPHSHPPPNRHSNAPPPPPPPSNGRVIPNGVCFEFANNGTCRFGDTCKFRHER